MTTLQHESAKCQKGHLHSRERGAVIVDKSLNLGKISKKSNYVLFFLLCDGVYLSKVILFSMDNQSPANNGVLPKEAQERVNDVNLNGRALHSCWNRLPKMN